MKDLHIYFYSSDNRKTHDVIKNVREDITAEEVQSIMERIVIYDEPTQKGVRRYERIASAKLVETVEEILFVNHEKPVVAPRHVTLEEAEAEHLKRIMPKPEKEEKTITQSELSLTEMTRYSPLKIATIMVNDVKTNGGEAIPRYLSNLMHLQVMNELRPYDKKVGTTYFTPVLMQMYKIRNWREEMVICLPHLKKFFTPPQWSQVLTQYRRFGREVAARLAGSAEEPDYAIVDQHLQEIETIAQQELEEYNIGRDQLKAQIMALSATAS